MASTYTERVGFSELRDGYARIGGPYAILEQHLWGASVWDVSFVGRGAKGISIASRDGCFLISPWQRGKWSTWRAINKLNVITSYHPYFFSDDLPHRICGHADLPRTVTSQGYWPFRPEEVEFRVIPRICIRDVRYDWWGRLILQTTGPTAAHIMTRPFSRERLRTVLDGFDWPPVQQQLIRMLDKELNASYQLEPDLSAESMIDVLGRSGLAERRPVDDPDRIRRMIEQADIVLTARVDGRLVGVSRAITDFSYCCYLSDLAVDGEYQGQGIGRELIRRTHETAGLDTTLILLSAPGAVSYYPHIGMQRHESCWVIPKRS